MTENIVDEFTPKYLELKGLRRLFIMGPAGFSPRFACVFFEKDIIEDLYKKYPAENNIYLKFGIDVVAKEYQKLHPELIIKSEGLNTDCGEYFDEFEKSISTDDKPIFFLSKYTPELTSSLQESRAAGENEAYYEIIKDSTICTTIDEVIKCIDEATADYKKDVIVSRKEMFDSLGRYLKDKAQHTMLKTDNQIYNTLLDEYNSVIGNRVLIQELEELYAKKEFFAKITDIAERTPGFNQ